MFRSRAGVYRLLILSNKREKREDLANSKENFSDFSEFLGIFGDF
jgi:hypothetical protein